MFSIDLLKGKGLPEQVDLKKSAFKLVPILIPVLAMTVFAAALQHQGATLRDYQHAEQENQQQIEHYGKDVAEYNKISAGLNRMKKCLKGVSKALSYRVQVSDMLVELVQSLPEGIFVYEMKLDRSSVKQKVQQPDSETFTQRLVVNRKLDLVLCTYGASGNDRAVQEYVKQLKESPLLKEIFLDIKPSARQQGQVDGQPAIYYEIECVLREQG
jgi:Tfp pilus assembly protein PilN